MAKLKLTPQQQSVVDHRGDALLVSAAAGSGKTKVLVDRLLQMVCDNYDPCNIDDFLIITYTEAAASELRGKIIKAIGSMLANDPANKHLRKQLTRIYSAQISTVHSFCAGLLRNYAYMLDIPSDFRIGDQNECRQLQTRAMDDILSSAYEELDKHPEVRKLFESIGYGRNDRKTVSLILEAYQKVQCHPDPDSWMEACRQMISCDGANSVSDTVWGKYLLKDMSSFLHQQTARMERARNKLPGSGMLEAYIPVFDDNIALLKRLAEDLSWDRCCTTKIDFGKLPSVRNCEDANLKAEVSSVRKSCKKYLETKLASFTETDSEALADLKCCTEPLLGLLHLVKEFDSRFSKLKRQQRILDFNDLEHMTIRLLVDKYTNRPRAVAKEIAQRYRQIMVDEYQDSNQVQDTIFRAISKDGKNLFMVGDVKQSIYSFRLADPGIFLEKYHRYTAQSENHAVEPRKILLSMNFRSGREVIDAINHVFYAVMSEDVGGLTYGDDESLKTSREYADLGEPAVELHCINVSKDDEDEQSAGKLETEAAFTAKRIRELLDGEHYIPDGESLRRIQPEDIVILMRSVASNAPAYRDALAKQGILSFCERSGDIFTPSEVSVLLAWLRIVDNPHQDIPLVTAMASPLGGFSADEIAQIRIASKYTDLYDALILCAEQSEKHANFLHKLSMLRDAVQWMTLTDLFDFVCSETAAYTVFGAMDDGALRKQNLSSLRDLCHKASGIGIRDLGGYLRYIDSMIENGAKIDSAVSASSGVTIMSIHKSKGLEFPVVFLCDLSRRFNTEDLRSAVLMDQDLFIGSNIVDKNLMIQYPSIARRAISIKKKHDLLSEELRILYVGMTRAKDRLIMTYCSSNLESQIAAASLDTSSPVQSCVAGTVSCPGQWILLSAALRPEASAIFGGGPETVILDEKSWLIRYHEGCSDTAPNDKKAKEDKQAAVLTDTTVALHKYSFDPFTQIPTKLTATQIKGRLLDSELDEGNVTAGRSKPHITARSHFLGEKKLTAAEKGTAMHLFMQYCCYEKCLTEEGIEEEISRLLKNAYLTQQQAEAINCKKILQFFQSQPGRLVTSDAEIHREFKFSVMVDSGRYFAGCSGDEIMLQGVVDCFIVKDGEIYVMDFKTDRVTPGKEEERTEFYRPQLTAYREALERIYGLPVTKCFVYFFETGKTCTL